MMEFAFVLLVLGAVILSVSFAGKNMTNDQRVWGCVTAAAFFFSSSLAFSLVQ